MTTISPIKLWRRQKYIKTNLGKIGKVLSWTNVEVPDKVHKDYAPYIVALVEFNDGKKNFGQLIDCSVGDLEIGKKVVAVLRKMYEPSAESVIFYGTKFQLI